MVNPKRIRTDNGPEFRSKNFQTWMNEQAIEWSPIQNGKPQPDGILERFNRTYREDVLDAWLFTSLEQAQQMTEERVEEDNGDKPHQALGYQTPTD